MRTITRDGHTFEIVDGTYNGWDFWGSFSNGTWEPSLLREIGALPAGSLLFDVGAWIGPISLWAAARGVRSIAIEPDPVALEVLKQNVEANNYGDMITIVPKAILAAHGVATLNIQNGGGDSQSSMARTNMPDSIEVEGISLESLFLEMGIPDLIKMDIEGYEGVVVPSCGPALRTLGIPLLLALHWGWLPEGTREALENELSQWNAKMVEEDAFLYLPL